MAGFAFIDHVDTLECKEVNGVIRSLTRLFRVLGVQNTDYTVLWEALNNAGIPTAGQKTDDAVTLLENSPFVNLSVVDRSAKIVDKDRGCVDVTVVYQHMLDGPNQSLNQPANTGGIIFGKVKTSIQQKQTNFTVNPDGSQELITVKYTYPKTDPNYAGQTITQTGTIEVPLPMKTYSLQGYMLTLDPSGLANQFIASVNADIWNNEAPRTWLCTEASYERMTYGQYLFGFEFQHNPDGWDPTVLFIDDRSNRPPPDLKPGVGYYTIEYLEGVDFNSLFASLSGGSTDVG